MTKDLRTLTLILDDELPIVNMLSRVCEQEGHQVRPFMRASEALQCLADEPIDLLITDMCMPESDGMTVTEEAWRLRPDLYVLIITGHAGMFPVENLLAGGHADIMFKPFRLNEFRARLDLAQAAARADRAPQRGDPCPPRGQPQPDFGVAAGAGGEIGRGRDRGSGIGMGPDHALPAFRRVRL